MWTLVLSIFHLDIKISSSIPLTFEFWKFTTVHSLEIKESGTVKNDCQKAQIHTTVVEPYFCANESIF